MIVALTGAGISKASGIPTFEDREDLRDKLDRDFANSHPEEYREVMRELVSSMRGKEPNDAHYALADFYIPVITMNIDSLHQLAAEERKADRQIIIPVHGRLPIESELDYCDKLRNTPVLYGDIASKYRDAFKLIDQMKFGDTLLIIGTSFYTSFSINVKIAAVERGASIVEIDDNAETKVREFLERRSSELGDWS